MSGRRFRARTAVSAGRDNSSLVLAAGFVALILVTCVLVLAGGTRHLTADLAAVTVLTAAVCMFVKALYIPLCAEMAWMFLNGFLVDRHAALRWHGHADTVRLTVLLSAAVLAGGAGHLIAAPGRAVVIHADVDAPYGGPDDQ